ncbi:MAG: flavin reductase family protein [Ginsengibacter sp.]
MSARYKTIVLQESSMQDAQHYLQHAIAPRPICFASTIDNIGNVNLSPFSFFNLFSYEPPIVIFSTVRRVRNNSIKHTLENIEEVPEVCINIATYDIVQQVSLSSCEYPKGVNEFTKAGFTEEPSQIIRPPRVKESKIQLECKVLEIKSLGSGGGAGILIIAEVLLMHINREILDENEKIDQRKIELTARLGGNWYAHITPANLFVVAKPNTALGIGIDMLPDSIRSSKILTGNHLGRLGNVKEIPLIDASFEDDRLKNIFQYYSIDPDEMENELHTYAACLLDADKIHEAWQVLLALA